jgi:hypothetical protein
MTGNPGFPSTAKSRDFGLPLLAGLLLVLALALVSCGQSKDGSKARVYRPPAFHPELFPDIKLPPAFVLEPGRDQLAVVYAGGNIRRFEVSMIQKEGSKDQRPAGVLDLYKTWLPEAGWQAVSSASHEQRWRKVDAAGRGDELVVRSGRTGSRTTIQFHLRPVGIHGSS